MQKIPTETQTRGHEMFGLSPAAYILLNLLTVASASLMGLLSIWAALADRPHWSVRCGVLLGVVLLPFLIPAHELVVMYLAQALVVIVVLFFWRTFRKKADGRRSRFQFSLRDILLLTLLTAVVLAAASSAQTGSWEIGKIGFHLLSGVVLGLTTLLACGLVFAKRWLWRSVWLTVLTMAFAAAALVHYYDRLPRPNDPFALGIITVVIVAWILLAKRAGFSTAKTAAFTESNPTALCLENKYFHRSYQIAWVSLSLLILIPTAGTLYFLATPPPIPQTTLPEPNGYDTLVRVGKELQSLSVPDLDTLDTLPEQSLAAFMNKSDPLLTQAREALNEDCQVPTAYTKEWWNSCVDNMSLIRELARGFAVQGHIAHKNGDDLKAVECHLTTIKLGKAVAPNGLLIDAYVGVACEKIGLQQLHELLPSLSDEQLMELTPILHSMQNTEEPIEAAVAREEIASYYALGWQGRLLLMFEQVLRISPFSAELPWETADNVSKQRLSHYRILLIEIALSQYYKKHRIFPRKLKALVPEFLDKLPEEPHGAGEFVYRLKETTPNTNGKPGYELYSPGPNCRDDGGAPNTTNASFDDVGFFW